MKGNRPSRTAKRSPAEETGALALLVIDERPIRKEAFKAYRKAERQVARARDQIEFFETADLPSFIRWDAQVFGPLMSELREITSALDEKKHLLALIDEEVFWANCSRADAYLRVTEARNNPTPPQTGPAPEGDGAAKHSDDSEIPKVFGTADLPPGFDIDEYDRLSRKQQKEVYEAYEDAALLFEMINGIPAPQFDDLIEQERERRHGKTAEDKTERSQRLEDQLPTAAHATPPPGREWTRIKEIYRILVRRLHPDMGGAHTVHERDLWQQVQDAYKARDLEWLESIHGRLEILHQGAASLPLQILRRMTADLQSALHGLRSQMAKLRRHPGWKFHKRTVALSKFEARRRRGLERQLARQRKELDRIERILNKLATRVARESTRKRRAKSTVRKGAAQEYFPF